MNWVQLIWAIYAQMYVVLGVAIAARAVACPPSAVRTRIFCLAGFSILHAAYSYFFPSGGVEPEPLGAKAVIGIQALSFVALYYFALWENERKAVTLHALVLATSTSWLLVAAFVADPRYLEILTRLAIGMPASFCAAIMLVRNPLLRLRSKDPRWAVWISASSLAVYGFTLLFISPPSLLSASHASSGGLENASGIFPNLVRSGVAVIFMSATLGLLHRFDHAMRYEAARTSKDAHNALRITEGRLAAILKMSPEGIIISDSDGNITMFSDGAREIFGYRAEEVIGRGIERLIPARFRDAHRRHVADFEVSARVGRKMGDHGEITGLRKNGEEFPLEASICKLETINGCTFTTIVRDISRRREEHNQLVAAKLKAEEASRMKSRFIANMSHELRTPLNAILGFSELLRSETFAAKRDEYAAIIHQSGTHLLTLINDILDLSKIEAGRFELHESLVDLKSLIQDCVELISAKAGAGRISLRVDLPEGLSPFCVDERAIRQIVLNLLSNAVKFTRTNGTVTAFGRFEPDGRFAFGVKDDGVGIAPEDLAQVFDRFGQGRHDIAEPDKGTGLGLPIVKGLAIAHGGSVDLRSEVNAGTTVTVFLPANRARKSQPQQAA